MKRIDKTFSKKYGPLDHDVTMAVLAKLGPGMAVCGQVVNGDNKFGGYVALHLARGTDWPVGKTEAGEIEVDSQWIEVARASTRTKLLAKIKKLKRPKGGTTKEGNADDESPQTQSGPGDPRPR